MKTIEIKIETKEETVINVEIPSYYSNELHFIKIISETEAIIVKNSNGYKGMELCKPSTAFIVPGFNPCTKDEFNDVFSRTINDMLNLQSQNI
jgi:hypothetical protein